MSKNNKLLKISTEKGKFNIPAQPQQIKHSTKYSFHCLPVKLTIISSSKNCGWKSFTLRTYIVKSRSLESGVGIPWSYASTRIWKGKDRAMIYQYSNLWYYHQYYPKFNCLTVTFHTQEEKLKQEELKFFYQ